MEILQQQRKNAEETFSQLEIPSFKYGQGMVLDLRDLNFDDFFASIQRKEQETITITAPKEVIVKKLSEMGKEFVENYAQTLVQVAEDKLTALHYSSLNDASVIIIPKDCVVEKPILISSHLKLSQAEHIIVVAEERSKATILEIQTSDEKANYKTQIVQVYAKQGAEISYSSLQNFHQTIYSFIKKRGQAAKDSTITWHDFVAGGKFTQLHLKTILAEEGAQVRKFTAYYGTENQLFDVKTDSVHLSSKTKSWMQAKGVLAESSKGVYQGTVKIQKQSKNCVGQQMINTLLIGEKARTDTVPILEVENDDVTCSHGATIGQLDEEQLFYLLSRGLNPKDAKRMLIKGFLETSIKEFPDEEMRQKIKTIIEEKVK